MNQTLTKLEDSVADLKACLSILGCLRVKVDSVQVAQTESGPPGAHVVSDELCNLLESIRCFNAFRYEEVEEVRVVHVLWSLDGKCLRLGMSIEVIKLVLEQVNLILARNYVLTFLLLLLSLSGNWSEVVIYHVEYARLLFRCCGGRLLLRR